MAGHIWLTKYSQGLSFANATLCRCTERPTSLGYTPSNVGRRLFLGLLAQNQLSCGGRQASYLVVVATPVTQQVELLETEVWRHGDS